MILDERTARQQLVEEAAHKIMIAARTAPKGKGVDVVEIGMLTGEEICLLSDEMRRIGWKIGQKFYHRDADNILLAEAVILIGSRDHCQGSQSHPMESVWHSFVPSFMTKNVCAKSSSSSGWN